MGQTQVRKFTEISRRTFIGGSDVRIIMGHDEAALVRLWREKRGEADPEDLSGNLIVQLGSATEDLNRVWYERNTGRRVRDVQRHVKHSLIPWMAATLSAKVRGTRVLDVTATTITRVRGQHRDPLHRENDNACRLCYRNART